MEWLVSCLFGAIWLGGSWLCFRALRYAFTFVDFPVWLETPIIGLVSFGVGLLCVFSLIEIFINRSGWKKYRELLKSLALGILLPIVGCCIFAAMFYLFLTSFDLGEEKEKLIVGTVSALLYLGTMEIINKRGARIAEAEALDANIKGKHEEEKAAD